MLWEDGVNGFIWGVIAEHGLIPTSLFRQTTDDSAIYGATFGCLRNESRGGGVDAHFKPVCF